MITLAMLRLKVGVVEDKVVVLVELIFQIFLKIFLEILVVDNQGEEEKLTIEALIYDMIYLLLLKKPMKVKNRISNSQQQKNVTLVKVMALNLVIIQTSVRFVVEMVK